MKKVMAQGFIVVLDFGLMSLANFVVSMLLARSVIPEEYSLYVLATSLLMMVLSVQKALVATPYTVIAPKLAGQKKSEFQGTGLLLTAAIVITFIIAVLVFAGYSDSQYEEIDQFKLVLILFYCWALFFLLREHMRIVMLADLNVKQGFIANVTGSALILVVLPALYLGGKLTLETLLFCLIASTIIPSALMFLIQNKSMRFAPRSSAAHVAKYWSIGKWNIANAVLYTGANLSLPWLILFFADKKSVAVYGVCLAFASAANPLLRGVNGYLFPKMSHSYHDNGTANLWRITKMSILVMLIPFSAWLLAVLIWGDSLITMLYSDEYTGYQWVLSLIVLKTVIETISTPINSALQTIEKAFVITVSLSAAMLITFGLGILLIQREGLIGAAIIGVLSSILMLFIKYIWLHKFIQNSDAGMKIKRGDNEF